MTVGKSVLVMAAAAVVLSGCQTTPGQSPWIPHKQRPFVEKYRSNAIDFKALAISGRWCPYYVHDRASPKRAISDVLKQCGDYCKSGCRLFMLGNRYAENLEKTELDSLAIKYSQDVGGSSLSPAATSMTAAPPSAAMSIEEARRITAEFAKQPFEAPPRRVDGLVTALNDPSWRNALAMAEARKVVDQPLAEDKRADFLRRRATAAMTLGRFQSAIADISEANRLDPAVSHQQIRSLAFANYRAGYLKEAAELMERTAETCPPNDRCFVIHYAILANIQAVIGDLEAAERSLAKALQWPAKRRNTLANLDRAKGYIAIASGRYGEAESFFRKYIKYVESLQQTSGIGSNRERLYYQVAALSQSLHHQGRLAEAEAEGRRSLLGMLEMFGRNAPQTAMVLRRLIETVYEQGRYQDAEVLSRIVVDIFRSNGVSPGSELFVSARATIARTLAHQGRWRDSAMEFDTIEREITGNTPARRKFIENDTVRALAMIHTGRADTARADLEKALERAVTELGDTHRGTNELRGVLALAQMAGGDKAGALRNFATAVPVLLGKSQGAEDEETSATARSALNTHVLEGYIGILSEATGTSLASSVVGDPVSLAFSVADAARNQTVQLALNQSAARASFHDPELADLARREQDARKRISTLYGHLTRQLAEESAPGVLQSLRLRIAGLQAARGALINEIDERFPDYAALITPTPPTIEQTREFLLPDEALVSFYVGGDKTYVWAVPKQGKVAFAVVNLGKTSLAGTVSRLRQALEPTVKTIGDIPDFDVAAAYGLYEKLLKPVEPRWRNAKGLLVVADGPLGQLPLSLLPTKLVNIAPEKFPLFSNHRHVPWLARTHAVTVLPSVASLKAQRGTTTASAKRRPFVGFGDPYFSKSQELAAVEKAEPFHVASAESSTRGRQIKLRSKPQMRGVDSATLALLPRLPDTRPEINAIAASLGAEPARDVFLGRRAGEGRVKAMDLADYKVIAFATHGLVAGDLNGLNQPALALSSPKVTGSQEDGLLTMGEILGLKLNADWVVLSACNTASADGQGAAAVSGLGRAFFYAGTKALLVSNWPVHSAATTELTTELFRRQAADSNLSRAEALRQTRVHLIDQAGFKDAGGRTLFSYAHPIFWAPFTVVGDGGGATMPET